MARKTAETTMITRDDLTDNSRVLLDSGRIAIHPDCILAMQVDGTWIREDFISHMRTQADEETPETATGDITIAE